MEKTIKTVGDEFFKDMANIVRPPSSDNPLTNSQCEMLSDWCKAKQDHSKKSKAARQAYDLVKSMEPEIRKVITRAGKTVTNGEYIVSYTNKNVKGYIVEARTQRSYNIVKADVDYADVSKGK
jgi:hypothetical protein